MFTQLQPDRHLVFLALFRITRDIIDHGPRGLVRREQQRDIAVTEAQEILKNHFDCALRGEAEHIACLIAMLFQSRIRSSDDEGDRDLSDASGDFVDVVVGAQ
ncbi:hypothetical protein SDC9_158362 [bioreactor metagenome]|uniref:Uncharacterized protein n=1 Tax=bioreactor metagenome TaxID=1076179 RepID=A0A645F9T4_9ZZZZ